MMILLKLVLAGGFVFVNWGVLTINRSKFPIMFMSVVILAGVGFSYMGVSLFNEYDRERKLEKQTRIELVERRNDFNNNRYVLPSAEVFWDRIKRHDEAERQKAWRKTTSREAQLKLPERYIELTRR